MVRTAFFAVAAGALVLRALPGRAAGMMLESEITAKNVDEAVVFTVRLTNRSDRDVIMRFTSAARLALLVCDSSRTVIWDSTADRMFAAVTAETIVPAGGSQTFSETWPRPPAHGSFIVHGSVRALPPVALPERTFTR